MVNGDYFLILKLNNVLTEEILDNHILFGIHAIREFTAKAKENLAYPNHDWDKNLVPVYGSHYFEGQLYDIGFYYDVENNYVSAHIVYGDEPGEYLSGDCFWGSSLLYRKLAWILYCSGILKKEVLIDQYAKYTDWENFYKEG